MAERELRVTIVGDSDHLQKSIKAAQRSTQDLGNTSERASKSISEDAQRNVAASAKRRESLQGLETEYRQIASSAKKGSAEEVAATKLADKASRQLGDTKQQVAGQSERASSRMTGAFDKIAKAAAVGFGLHEAGQFASKLGNQAVRLDVFARKSQTVFEGSTADIRKWSKENARDFGTTNRELEGMAANFGDLLKPMGFTSAQAADMSTKVIGLAGALSAWTGGQRSAAEVTDTLSKAMLGEREELKGLGISITEADVKARLLAKGQQDLTGAALQQAEAIATQELIFEKSADAQKAWADGSLDAVKKQNAFKSMISEVREELATRLGPALAIVGQGMTTLGPIAAGVGGLIQSGLLPPLAQVRASFAHWLSILGPLGLALGAGVLAQSLTSTDEKIRKLAQTADKELLAAFNKVVESNNWFSPFFDILGTKTDKATEKFKDLAEQSPATAQRLIDAMRASGEETGKFEGILAKVGEGHKQAATDAQGNAVATDAMAEAQKRAADATKALTTKLGELVGIHVSESQALTTFHANLDTLKAKLAENGVSLDVTSEKGRQNRGAIDSMVTGITSHIDALAREGATMDTMRSTFDRHINDFARTLRQAGFTEAQIESLKNEYGLVPKNVETTLRALGEAEYNAAMERARWKAVSLYNMAHDIGIKLPGRFRGLAAGGLLPGGGETNGPVTIVGEGNRAHPEFVIPTDPQYRQRATGLFMKLGDELDLLAAGGMLGRPHFGNRIDTNVGPLGRAIGAAAEAHWSQLEASGLGGAVGQGWRAITNLLSSRGVPYTITSTYRPGDPGFHGRGKAVDMVGNMTRIFRALENVKGINELFYSPMRYSIDNGRRTSYLAPGHYDHVHAATFDQGGVIMPGLNLIANNTGRGEVVPDPRRSGGIIWTGDLIVQGADDPDETARVVLQKLQAIARRGTNLHLTPG